MSRLPALFVTLLLPAAAGLAQQPRCNPCVDGPETFARPQTGISSDQDGFVITAQEMRNLGVVSLADMLRQLPGTQPACQALVEYGAIVSTVTERFYDRTFNGLDWPARTDFYRSQIACGMSAEAIAAVVNALLAELGASHTALYTKADQHYWGLNSLFWRTNAYANGQTGDAYQINYSGIWAVQRNGSWFASAVMEGSPAARAGVRVGDELIAIDGRGFDPLGFGPGTSKLTVASDGRSQRNLTLQTALQSIMLGFEQASRASARVLTADDARIGFIHLWAGGGAILDIENNALREFADRNLDALILDLRKGYGGMGPEFLDELRSNPRLQDVPKYFLIDDSVRSGKELVAGIVERDGIGTLVGTTTSGQYLAGMRVTLFDDKYFLYVAVRDGPTPVLPGIGRIEDNGIAPDVRVEPCRAYCAGRDPELERAIELITNRSDP